ncbi:MAG: SCO family protein [Bacteroidota bacterium]
MSAIVFLRNSVLIVVLLFVAIQFKPTNQVQGLPYYNTPEFSPMFLSSRADVESKITHTIGRFTFVNQDGDTLTEKAIKGKIHVADFIFTSCGNICPMMTDQMGRIGKAFENDTSVVILSYTVTPWIDNPARLKKYKADKGIKKNNWYFLTGNKAAIYKLARQSYFAEESLGFTKDSTKFLHTEHFLLVDATQRIRGIYNGTLQLEAEQLIKDIKELKRERLD